MCVVSMVGDHYRDKLDPPKYWPYPWTAPSYPDPLSDIARRITSGQEVTRAEFDKLREEMQEMHELLKKAKQYDAARGEPLCEDDKKWELLRKIAEKVGVNLDT